MPGCLGGLVEGNATISPAAGPECSPLIRVQTLLVYSYAWYTYQYEGEL